MSYSGADWQSALAALASGDVGLGIVTPSANFTRPANTTAYALGDIIANNTVAGSVVPLSWSVAKVEGGAVSIRRARLKKSTTSVTLAIFRLHLYSSSPVPANGDNGVWLTPNLGYLGSIDLDASGVNGRVFSDAAAINGVPSVGQEINADLAAGLTIYGLLEARAAYTPGNAEVFTVDLEVQQV